MLRGEDGQRNFRAIFIFGGKDHNVRPLVVRKRERLASQEIGTGDCGTPVLFNVLNDQIIPREVADKWLHGGVVHRVGHVAHQCNIHPLIDHLPDRKRPAEDTHVGVNTHHDDIFNPATFHQPEGFVGIGDRVTFVNFDVGNLA